MKSVVVVRFSVFVDKVRNGVKKQTIRLADAYSNLKVGMKVHCYSTKKVPGLMRPVLDKLLCVGECTEIILTKWGSIKDNDEIAMLDGFSSAREIQEWFEKHYDIEDETALKIIRWKQLSLNG